MSVFKLTLYKDTKTISESLLGEQWTHIPEGFCCFNSNILNYLDLLKTIFHYVPFNCFLADILQFYSIGKWHKNVLQA